MSKANQIQNNQEMDVEVLYQKLGDRWFAFSLIGDEVFMSPISEDQINGIRNETRTRPELNHEAA
jgi:hypothetical protein